MCKMRMLTILIPSKNKLQYVYNSLLALEGFDTDIKNSIYVYVVDNSPNCNLVLVDKIQSISNCIRYFHNKNPSTIIENFDYAISLVETEYLSIIGDDDFFDPRIVEWTRYAKHNEIDCLIYDYNQYYWPDLKFAKENK